MKRRIETLDEFVSESLFGGLPAYKSFEHGSTVVKVNNKTEQDEVLMWGKKQGKNVSDFMWKNAKFPIAYGFSGKIVGFVDRMDRALYYMSFEEFKEKTKEK